MGTENASDSEWQYDAGGSEMGGLFVEDVADLRKLLSDMDARGPFVPKTPDEEEFGDPLERKVQHRLRQLFGYATDIPGELILADAKRVLEKARRETLLRFTDPFSRRFFETFSSERGPS